AVANRNGIRKIIKAGAPRVLDPLAVDYSRIGAIHRKQSEAEFAGKLLAARPFFVVSRARGKSLAFVFLKIRVASKVWFLFQKQKIVLAKEISCGEAACSTADDDDVVTLGNGRMRKDAAIADLVANLKVIAVHLRLRFRGRGEQRKVNWASSRDRTRDAKCDVRSERIGHAVSPSNADARICAAGSSWTAARVRR